MSSRNGRRRPSGSKIIQRQISPPQPSGRAQPKSKNASPLRKVAFTGTLPSFNDWHSIIADNQNDAFYIFGGCAKNDDSPCSDFYRCDIKTMHWENLTDRVRHVKSLTNPFSAHAPRPIPARHKPACSLLTLNSRNFMLVYGGRKQEVNADNVVCSDFIVVDLQSYIWFFIPLEPGIPRESARMVVVENRVFLFGGCIGQETHLCDNSVQTFSMAQYDSDGDTGAWSWAVREQKYPGNIPIMGYDCGAIAVYDGQKILLCQGRKYDCHTPSLSSESFILIHTRHLTFQVQSATVGEFPQECHWYRLRSSVSPVVHGGVSAMKRRKIGTVSSSSSSRSHPLNSSSTRLDESALLCAWSPHPEQPEFLVPEIYLYLLPPREECKCLNLRDKLWALNLDLQAFVVVNGRAFLMGFDGDEAREPPFWNVVVEIQLDNLEISE